MGPGGPALHYPSLEKKRRRRRKRTIVSKCRLRQWRKSSANSAWLMGMGMRPSRKLPDVTPSCMQASLVSTRLTCWFYASPTSFSLRFVGFAARQTTFADDPWSIFRQTLRGPPKKILQSWIKTFLLNFDNTLKMFRWLLPTPNLHYGAIFQPAIPET